MFRPLAVISRNSSEHRRAFFVQVDHFGVSVVRPESATTAPLTDVPNTDRQLLIVQSELTLTRERGHPGMDTLNGQSSRNGNEF